LVNNLNTYTLERHIVEIDGVRDRKYISEFVATLRVGDASALRKFLNKIDCGVDLQIKVGTPRGGSIETFLPLNVKFFWPDITV